MSRDLHRVSLLDLGLDRKHFYGKDEIKPWLQEILLKERNIHIVIERSDTTKIIFKCKNSIKKEIIKPKNDKAQIRRHTTCPFKIRANYSLKNKLWSLVVISDTHDHPLDISDDRKPDAGAGIDRKAVAVPTHSPPANNAYPRVDDMFNPSPEEPPHMVMPPNSNNTSASDVFSNLMGSTGSITSVGMSDATTPKKNKESAEFPTQQNYFPASPNSRKRGMLVTFDNHQLQPSKTSIRASTDDEVRTVTDSRSVDEVALFLRKETNRLINLTILNNSNLSKKEKTSLLDSVSSQFILDHKDHLSEKFVESLHQNRFKRKDSEERPAEDLRKRKRAIQLQEDQGRVLPSQKSYQQKKTLLNSWLGTPNSGANALNANPTTNLIPLSPLLNDSDNEYSGAGTNGGGLGGSSFDNLTQIPPNAAFSHSSNANSLMGNGVVIPNQVLSIQNQSQQLPSFNSIQNRLPLSPGNAALSLFGSNVSGNSLIPPISNANNNTTLNPSHLLKGSGQKYNLLNLNQSGSGLLNDIKLGGSFPMTANNENHNKSRNETNTSSGLQGSGNANNLNNLLSSSSDPTSQQLNQLNASSFFSGMSSHNNFSGNSAGQSLGNGNSTVSANMLGHMGNFNDPGW